MPLCFRDRETAEKIAKELLRFAEIMLHAPPDEKAPVHPELKVMLKAFKNINGKLAKANKNGIITFAEMGDVAEQFQVMGNSLTGWGQVHGKTPTKR